MCLFFSKDLTVVQSKEEPIPWIFVPVGIEGEDSISSDYHTIMEFDKDNQMLPLANERRNILSLPIVHIPL
jgi:hypothetical protein